MTTIRRATVQDVDCCAVILEHAREYLRKQDLSQWQWGYPNRLNIETDVANGELYVACDERGTIMGGAMITMAGEPNYAHPLRGAWANPSPDDADATYACIHRVICAPEFRGRGVATALMNECERQAREAGKASCRVETHPHNAGMRRVAEKLGYVHCCDIASMHDQVNGRVAYEKILDPDLHPHPILPLEDDDEELQRLVAQMWARLHAELRGETPA